MSKSQTIDDLKNRAAGVPAESDKPVASAELPVDEIRRDTEEAAQTDPGVEQGPGQFDQFVRWEHWA
jgi:hypothetical protein